MPLIEKCASRVGKEKCAASVRDPAINLSWLAERAVLSLLFLQGTRHPFEASSSLLHRIWQRGDRSGDGDEAS
jgi:hypothetical protein